MKTSTSRREVLQALILFPLGAYACGGSSGGGGGDASAAADAGATTDAAASGDGATTLAWATGGTASMKDKASYPNPFAGIVNTTCALSCAMTQGPCYDSASEVIQDISYGQPGLPMRMYLQLVNESCQPVAGAVVEVWHVSPVGKYSGDDAVNENVGFCTGNDSAYTSKLYFRGKQTSDANGVLFFDTCFPGWYSSRTIHIHLTITVNGVASVTTQLFFDDALDDSIVGAQPIYDARGQRDTTNATDTVISGASVGQYSFQTRQMTDGAMLAWKTVVLRSATSEAACAVTGGGSMNGGPPDGGPGGPPPDGGPGGPLLG